MSRNAKRVGWVVGVLVLLTFLECMGIWIPGLDILFELLSGWITFLVRVMPKVQVRWDLVVSTAIYAIVLVGGAHGFLRWLCREMSRGPAGVSAGPVPRWRWRWTLSGFLIVILMFTAGMAAIGVLHQAAWLATSPKPLYERSGRMRDRVLCASNLRQIGQAVYACANDHGGKLPDDLATLTVNDTDLSPTVFVCPRTDDEFATGPTTRQAAENLRKPGHCSYIYLGKGLVGPVDPKRVLVLEPLANHDDEGINVLYGDGSVEWIDAEDARRLLKALGVAVAERGSAATRPG